MHQAPPENIRSLLHWQTGRQHLRRSSGEYLLIHFGFDDAVELSRDATELVWKDFEQHRVHVPPERVLAGDDEGLDTSEPLVVQERDERLATRVAAQDLFRGRAAHLVLSAVDEPAMKDETFVAEIEVVLEARDAGLPARAVEFADDGFVCGVDR